MLKIIDGKRIAEELRAEMKKDISLLKSKGISPKLHVILVGDNKESATYVRVKERACGDVGIDFELEKLPEDVREEDIISRVKTLNDDERVNGIIVQLPLPKHVDENRVLESITRAKDVDALTPYNIGRLVIGDETLSAATAKGVILLIEKSGIEIRGKNAVIINRSINIGKPLVFLLLNRDATVTVCHSKTRNLEDFTRKADIVVCAVGKPGFLKGDMIKSGSVIIDVGLTYVNGKGMGDVDFDSVKDTAAFLTPVPGGVGPMTVTVLLQNTVVATRKQLKV